MARVSAYVHHRQAVLVRVGLTFGHIELVDQRDDLSALFSDSVLNREGLKYRADLDGSIADLLGDGNLLDQGDGKLLSEVNPIRLALAQGLSDLYRLRDKSGCGARVGLTGLAG